MCARLVACGFHVRYQSKPHCLVFNELFKPQSYRALRNIQRAPYFAITHPAVLLKQVKNGMVKFI